MRRPPPAAPTHHNQEESQNHSVYYPPALGYYYPPHPGHEVHEAGAVYPPQHHHHHHLPAAPHHPLPLPPAHSAYPHPPMLIPPPYYGGGGGGGEGHVPPEAYAFYYYGYPPPPPPAIMEDGRGRHVDARALGPPIYHPQPRDHGYVNVKGGRDYHPNSYENNANVGNRDDDYGNYHHHHAKGRHYQHQGSRHSPPVVRRRSSSPRRISRARSRSPVDRNAPLRPGSTYRPGGPAPTSPPPPPPAEATSHYHGKQEQRKGGSGSGKPWVDPEYEKELHRVRQSLERPCRTLFIRSVSLSTTRAQLLALFEPFGPIRELNDQSLHPRGLIFISYYDIRHAKRAREEMHGVGLNGRNLDIHYSLPRSREEEMGICTPERNQGTLLVSLSPETRLTELPPALLLPMAEQYGQVAHWRPMPDQPLKLFLEFFDSRACLAAERGLNGCNLAGTDDPGILSCSLCWDYAKGLRVKAERVMERIRRGELKTRPSSRIRREDRDNHNQEGDGDDQDYREDDHDQEQEQEEEEQGQEEYQRESVEQGGGEQEEGEVSNPEQHHESSNFQIDTTPNLSTHMAQLIAIIQGKKEEEAADETATN